MPTCPPSGQLFCHAGRGDRWRRHRDRLNHSDPRSVSGRAAGPRRISWLYGGAARLVGTNGRGKRLPDWRAAVGGYMRSWCTCRRGDHRRGEFTSNLNVARFTSEFTDSGPAAAARHYRSRRRRLIWHLHATDPGPLCHLTVRRDERGVICVATARKGCRAASRRRHRAAALAMVR